MGRGLAEVKGKTRQVSKAPVDEDYSLANQHMRNTVRIAVRRIDGSQSVGTGFMQKFCEGRRSNSVRCYEQACNCRVRFV